MTQVHLSAVRLASDYTRASDKYKKDMKRNKITDHAQKKNRSEENTKSTTVNEGINQKIRNKTKKHKTVENESLRRNIDTDETNPTVSGTFLDPIRYFRSDGKSA